MKRKIIGIWLFTFHTCIQLCAIIHFAGCFVLISSPMAHPKTAYIVRPKVFLLLILKQGKVKQVYWTFFEEEWEIFLSGTHTYNPGAQKKKKTNHNFCSTGRNTLKFCMIIEYIPRNFCGKNFQKKIHNGGLNCENSFLGALRANSSKYWVSILTIYP